MHDDVPDEDQQFPEVAAMDGGIAPPAPSKSGASQLLNSDHLDRLAKRGIPEAAAIAAGLRSLTAEEVYAKVGIRVRTPGILIPYPGSAAFRIRLDEPHEFGGDKKPAKYLGPAGLSDLYMPADVVSRLRSDPAVSCAAIEGELKLIAVRAQLDIVAVAVAGCWGHRSKHQDDGIVPGLTTLSPLLRGRHMPIAIDSDARSNTNVALGAADLTQCLRNAGAIPSWNFPTRSIGEPKVGIDDLLLSKGPDAVRELLERRTEPEHPITFVFRQVVAAAVATRTANAPFVGTALFDQLREVLSEAAPALRPALAEEARVALGLPVQNRSALLAGLAAPERSDDDRQGSGMAFSDPTAWPEQVDGAALCDALLGAVRRYLVLPARADVALVLWIVFSWAFEAFYHSPRLALSSPTRRCGKTTALVLLKALVCRALLAANVSPSVVFRTIEAHQPTLLIDEWDSFAEGKDELRNVINAGHSRDGVVLRSDGDTFEPRSFSVWSPAAIASIGKLPATIADRAVEVPMRRKLKTERVDRLRGDRVQKEMEPFRRQLARWAEDHRDELKRADPVVPDSLDDRGADNWRPLLAIASVVGGAWPEKARVAALALSAERDAADDDSLGAALLRDVREVFGDADRMSSQSLVDKLVALDGRPWAELPGRGRVLTPTTMARLLKDFSIVSKSIRLEDGSTPKGYMRTQFEEAWATYVATDPVPGSATPPQVNGCAPLSATGASQAAESVAARGSPSTTGGASLVADAQPDNGEAFFASIEERLEERAAILEYECGLTREEAERRAWDEHISGRP
jgi:hypothetical protein